MGGINPLIGYRPKYKDNSSNIIKKRRYAIDLAPLCYGRWVREVYATWCQQSSCRKNTVLWWTKKTSFLGWCPNTACYLFWRLRCNCTFSRTILNPTSVTLPGTSTTKARNRRHTWKRGKLSFVPIVSQAILAWEVDGAAVRKISYLQCCRAPSYSWQNIPQWRSLRELVLTVSRN